MRVAGRRCPPDKTGLAAPPPLAYLARTMSLLKHFSPIRAVNDFRRFLSYRSGHELGFLALAVVVTGLIIAAFIQDSKIEKPYERNIIYVESWPLDRTDDEIAQQQAIDKVLKDRAQAAEEAKRKKRQEEFKRLDDKLKSWGI